MTESRTSSATEARDALPPPPASDPLTGPRADLARVIPRRPRVSWGLGLALALAFSILVLPAITADRWLGALSSVAQGHAAAVTVRVPPFAGHDTTTGHVAGGVLIARGETPDPALRDTAAAIEASLPTGPVATVAVLLLVFVLTGLFTHHLRRSIHGRLLRVQLVSLGILLVAALIVKAVMLTTSLSVLVIPVAVFAIVPTLVLDRVVGLATGTLAALLVALLVPFDVGVAIMLLVQAGAAGLVVAERPRKSMRAVVTAGLTVTLFTAATYPLMLYLTTGQLPLAELSNPLHSAWLASAVGPALATLLAVPLVPLYQLAVGEITQAKLVELDTMEHPLLRQIATKAPGTWQHSLMMANMAQLAANAIGANERLVRVGALYHDLGKSLQPKYFIENLEPGETSPHDKLPPEVSCDAIFAHVTDGILHARRAGLHERVIDFMHMHHGNGVLEYFWGRCKEQGNPNNLSVEHFRYPGIAPQSRETAILSIVDAVEAASRTLKKPEVSAIDNLVQRIVYGKLHLGQLDESGLSMGDLRRIAESLRETIRHANHSRIEYPWQKAQQDASAGANHDKLTQTGPRLDSLDRPGRPDTVAPASKRDSADALAKTDDVGATPNLKPPVRDSSELATKTTAPVARPAQAQAWKADAATSGINLSAEIPLELASGKHGAPTDPSTVRYPKENLEDIVELHAKPAVGSPKAPDPGSSLDESDARLRRVTNPVEGKRTSSEAIQFATEASKALADASKDLAVPRDPVPAASPSADSSVDIQIVSQQIVSEQPVTPPALDSARKRSATLPPAKPLAIPPVGRRSPTLPPTGVLRVPTPSTPPGATIAPPADLRPPAPAHGLPGVTAPPPVGELRPPAPNYLDDMITLRPQYEPRPGLDVRRDEDGTIRVSPPLSTGPSRADRDAAETAPNLELPLRAPASSPVIPLPDEDTDDDDVAFGTKTPVAAPTRAELQALLGGPPDVTRQQTFDEIEALHRKEREARERPSEELELTRRAPFPTSEVDEADIEAAIELAPPARRNAVGVAKKPKE